MCQRISIVIDDAIRFRIFRFSSFDTFSHKKHLLILLYHKVPKSTNKKYKKIDKKNNAISSVSKKLILFNCKTPDNNVDVIKNKTIKTFMYYPNDPIALTIKEINKIKAN